MDDEEEVNKPSSLTPVFSTAVNTLPLKFIGLTLLAYLLLSTDVFIDRILSNVKGAVHGDSITSYGTFVVALFLALFMIIFDILLKNNIL